MAKLTVHYTPRVFLVGQQCTNSPGINAFLHSEGIKDWRTDSFQDAEVLSEIAGRLCYMSFAKPRPGGNKKYLEHILESSHGTVLEHGTWNFIFTGVSRSLTHELVRHRAGMGYSQLSQRYVDESREEVVAPPELSKDIKMAEDFLTYRKENPDAVPGESLVKFLEEYPGADQERLILGEKWLLNVKLAFEAYKMTTHTLMKRIRESRGFRPDQELSHATITEIRKQARQTARSLLPNAAETKIFVTANTRALRHFLEMRGNSHADAEIRNLAIAVLKTVQNEAPHLFGDYCIVRTVDGIDEIRTNYKKV